MGCGDQFFMAGIGLGREELEADRDVAVVHILSLGKRRGWRAGDTPRRVSVAVSIRLERTFHRHADVVGLLLGQTGDHRSEERRVGNGSWKRVSSETVTKND